MTDLLQHVAGRHSHQLRRIVFLFPTSQQSVKEDDFQAIWLFVEKLAMCIH